MNTVFTPSAESRQRLILWEKQVFGPELGIGHESNLEYEQQLIDIMLTTTPAELAAINTPEDLGAVFMEVTGRNVPATMTSPLDLSLALYARMYALLGIAPTSTDQQGNMNQFITPEQPGVSSNVTDGEILVIKESAQSKGISESEKVASTEYGVLRGQQGWFKGISPLGERAVYTENYYEAKFFADDEESDMQEVAKRFSLSIYTVVITDPVLKEEAPTSELVDPSPSVDNVGSIGNAVRQMELIGARVAQDK